MWGYGGRVAPIDLATRTRMAPSWGHLGVRNGGRPRPETGDRCRDRDATARPIGHPVGLREARLPRGQGVSPDWARPARPEPAAYELTVRRSGQMMLTARSGRGDHPRRPAERPADPYLADPSRFRTVLSEPRDNSKLFMLLCEASDLAMPAARSRRRYAVMPRRSPS